MTGPESQSYMNYQLDITIRRYIACPKSFVGQMTQRNAGDRSAINEFGLVDLTPIYRSVQNIMASSRDSYSNLSLIHI